MAVAEEAIAIGQRARDAAGALANLSTDLKNEALVAMADGIEARQDFLLAENAKDVAGAKKKGISKAVIDRLTLNPQRVAAMAAAIRDIVGLPDPVRQVTRQWQRPNGLEVGKMRIPLGVITIIYEARPNVTADAASLCIKSGNAVILRGSSDAKHSNQAIGDVLREACAEAGAPEDAVQVVASTDRAMINELLKLEEYVDLVIPRGGEELIRFVAANSLVPVVKHYKGVCHVYVDSDADLDMAERISLNAKVQRPSVCNAMETLLVHEAVAPRFLPDVIGKLRESGVEVRGCDKTRALVGGIPAASEADWHEEYLDLVLAVRVVADMDEAIEHIRQYGSDHTETIVTADRGKAEEFIARVNSSAVLVNASTRFNDGGELGLGAEIGISTSKIHAFGPMGLEELTSTKFFVYGDGQVRT
ncbi:MAG: glutamate-5-semialdehyde dehydrogenase [Deltaproteobacteria bacterium]|nr:glutamate-5-semialdehyde dehydrogenase [Deltaproteobacteria bacterium]